MGPVTFGTSGWRGVIAEDFTFPGVRAVSQAIGEYILAEEPHGRRRGVVVGYDPRFLSEALRQKRPGCWRSRVSASSCATGHPHTGHCLRNPQTAGGRGIIVTASHNPPEYNGIKFSAAWGGPALPEATKQIEGRANAILTTSRVSQEQDRGASFPA